MAIQTIAKVQKMVMAIDPKNAEYIMNDHRFNDKVESMEYFGKKGDDTMVGHMENEIKKYAEEFDGRNLTPANAKVGDGATMYFYSDAHACTIVKVTKATITVQRDHAERTADSKPEFVVGGFAGHCTNQNELKYTYTPDENAEKVTFRWSKKYNEFRESRAGTSVGKGRHEHYDYNF